MDLKRECQLLHATLVEMEGRLNEIERRIQELRGKPASAPRSPRRAAKKRGASAASHPAQP